MFLSFTMDPKNMALIFADTNCENFGHFPVSQAHSSAIQFTSCMLYTLVSYMQLNHFLSIYYLYIAKYLNPCYFNYFSLKRILVRSLTISRITRRMVLKRQEIINS
jgi:hypothetical protein